MDILDEQDQRLLDGNADNWDPISPPFPTHQAAPTRLDCRVLSKNDLFQGPAHHGLNNLKGPQKLLQGPRGSPVALQLQTKADACQGHTKSTLSLLNASQSSCASSPFVALSVLPLCFPRHPASSVGSHWIGCHGVAKLFVCLFVFCLFACVCGRQR